MGLNLLGDFGHESGELYLVSYCVKDGNLSLKEFTDFRCLPRLGINNSDKIDCFRCHGCG